MDTAVALLLALTFAIVMAASTYPSNEYVYSFNRDMLIDAEHRFEKKTDTSSWVSDANL